MKFVETDEIKHVLNILENTNQHIYITGKAGTGKSTVLKKFMETTEKYYTILAPTGIAALNVNGQTIHKFYSLPIISNGIMDTDVINIPSRLKSKIKHIDMFIIDEVSMVRSDIMDGIDYIMRKCCKNNLPFGGKQMVFVGDLYQIPPVCIGSNRKDLLKIYHSEFFFSANVFQNSKFTWNTIELSKIFRQKDEKYINALNNIRDYSANKIDIDYINKNSSSDVNPLSIILTTNNNKVDSINEDKLDELDEELCIFDAYVSGDYTNERNLPAPRSLEIKVGAKIMMLTNDRDERWQNGTIGIVHDINTEDDIISVTIDNETYQVGAHKWEKTKSEWNKEKEKNEIFVTGLYEQFPIRLAYAVTIHKSQGQTFDDVYLDMKGCNFFVSGQLYVALSRCKTLEGITLSRYITLRDISPNPMIKKFHEIVLN